MLARTWNPFRELEELRRELDRVFEDFAQGEPVLRVSFLPGLGARSYPLLNLSEDTDNLYAEALAPGVDPKSLNVTVLRNILRIEGEKPGLSPEIKPEAFHRNERSAGRFVRSIKLPVEVDSEKVVADYQNGLLLITMPKAEEAKPKQITVNVN